MLEARLATEPRPRAGRYRLGRHEVFMNSLWNGSHRRIRGERIAVIILTVMFMVGGAALAAVAVSLTGEMPAISIAR